jgi:hypothetical protein
MADATKRRGKSTKRTHQYFLINHEIITCICIIAAFSFAHENNIEYTNITKNSSGPSMCSHPAHVQQWSMASVAMAKQS